MDPEQHIESVIPMGEIVSRTKARSRFTALLMSVFAGVALALTAVGLYGLIAYFVAARKCEIAIRVALDARA